MNICIRCGRTEKLEEHHVIERWKGGTDEPENKEWRCSACHDYEHARRNLLASLEYAKQNEWGERVKACQHRIDVLDVLNTPEVIKERGTYQGYWVDSSTHFYPDRIKTPKNKKEAQKLESQLELWKALGIEL